MTTVTMYSHALVWLLPPAARQLDREGIAYEVVDIEHHPTAAEVVERPTTATRPCRPSCTPTAPRRPTRAARSRPSSPPST